MVEAVVEFFLWNLADQVSKEAQLLQGVEDEIESIKRELRSMRAFLRDADQKRGRDEGVEAWVKDVRDLVYDSEDVIDKFIVQLDRDKGNGIMGYLIAQAYFVKDLKARHRFGSQIRKIQKEIKEVKQRRDRYKLEVIEAASSPSHRMDEAHIIQRVAYPFVEEADIVGIDEDIRKITKWLLEEGNEEKCRMVISIVGMGGSGKTTLAKKVYNNLKNRFNCHAWVSVSQSYNIKELLNEILKGFHESKTEVTPSDGIETMQMNELIKKIHNSLLGRRYILVLDDIWDGKAWDSLKQALPQKGGGKIIFTTRIGEVAKPINEFTYVHRIQHLSQDLAWRLFCKKAFQDGNHRGSCPQELSDIGKSIVKACKGVPLAIVAIGGAMSKKGTSPLEWKKIHDTLDTELVHNQDLKELNQVLLLSYNSLPFYLKYCFLYCSLFPEDYKIKRKKLISLWISEGFIQDHPQKTKTMEETAEKYFMELIDRSMLQVVETNYAGKVSSCKVHDLMRDFAIHTFDNENFGAICVEKHGTVKERSRRLSVHDHADNIPKDIEKFNLRSFLAFGMQDLPSPMIIPLLSSLTLLRVLDLQGARITQGLPSGLCDMIHLRYLGLRGTGIPELPPLMGKLHNLQTLDIRQTGVKCLPDGIKMLHHLRHLFIISCRSVYKEDKVVKMPMEGGDLRCLQTLVGVNASPGVVKELENLTQLKRLYVNDVREEVCTELCTSLGKMTFLRSLTIQQQGIREMGPLPLQLENLSSPPSYLEKLILEVRMDRLPKWVVSLNYLTRLVLRRCMLTVDPFSALQHLPSLMHLDLGIHSYIGKRIGGCACEGYPKLKKLRLVYLTKLEVWERIEEGAMPNLEEVSIDSCKKLDMLPEGFQNLASIKILELKTMHEKFIDRLREDGGEDHSKVQHIPKIIANRRILKGFYQKQV